MKPSAPALATAAISCHLPTRVMPPQVMGAETPNISVKRVLIMENPFVSIAIDAKVARLGSRGKGRLAHQGRSNVRMRKVFAFEQKWLVARFRQRVGKAIAEVQFRRMSTALAEIAIGLPRDPRLTLVYRADFDVVGSKN